MSFNLDYNLDYLIRITAQIGAVLFAVYSLLPTVVVRLTGWGALARGCRQEKAVAITFDDGPHPVYTPRVLAVLRAHNVPACFFCTAKQAQAYPHILRQIDREGHEIGLHGFSHRPLWLLSPWATKREFHEGSKIITDITGKPPAYFRPPWGLFNLSTWWWAHRYNQPIILWSYMSWDWTTRNRAEKIAALVLRRLHNGAILIFHDSDHSFASSRGSPEQMLLALPQVITCIKESGYRIVPLREIIATRLKNDKNRGKGASYSEKNCSEDREGRCCSGGNL